MGSENQRGAARRAPSARGQPEGALLYHGPVMIADDAAPRKMLPDDPTGWERGKWAFDPAVDEPWEDPSILRRRIGTKEELMRLIKPIVLQCRWQVDT